MNKMEKSELIQKISESNAAYAAGIPFMTDYDYDQLWQQLHSIDPEDPNLYHTAEYHPTVHNKTWHKYPVFGTQKAFNMDDLKPFLMRFGDQQLVLEPKYDGCAAVIEQTKLGLILTLEGNGQYGGDITHLLPHTICDFQFRHFQTVELIIPWKNWSTSFGKNPRNVVAGWLARKYEQPPIKMTAVQHNFGSLTESYYYSGDLEELSTLLLKLFVKWSAIYPMDGIMLKVADEQTRLIASHNGRANNWSIAWKPPIQTKQTIVTDVEWNVSRLGRVVPTVIYEPLDLCGTTNSRVTGNNAEWLSKKEIKVGSQITVGKAGEIIPKIVDVNNSTSPKEFELTPSFCPKCGESLTWEGVHLICNGPKCIVKLISSITYFYSPKGIMLDSIGSIKIEKMLQDKKLYEVLLSKMWALLDMKSYNIESEVFLTIGKGAYNQIVTGVANITGEKTMVNFISGLGLPKLGYKSSLRLCQYLKSGKLNIPVAKEAIKNFVDGTITFNDARKEMKNFNFNELPSSAKAIYCITGTLSQSRDDIIAYFAKLGYEFSTNVVRETNYLIIGENPGKLKIKAAAKNNIPTITEEQFIKLIEKENQNGH